MAIVVSSVNRTGSQPIKIAEETRRSPRAPLQRRRNGDIWGFDAVEARETRLVVDGVDHVGAPGDTVVGRVGVAEVVQSHLAKAGLLSLQADQLLESLTPVEIGVREDMAPSSWPSGEDIEIRKFVRMDAGNCHRNAAKPQRDRDSAARRGIGSPPAPRPRRWPTGPWGAGSARRSYATSRVP